ncbi:hypothetical protein B0181_02900 [Moraxella caviae]|uniref:Uncharacterized protein n=1 Tax=Moraxella caviae TaxID=34060 RepID=A0A1T0A776_9GAMM|nr:hypothetical protein B0181_02900 [Moraxella caviae]
MPSLRKGLQIRQQSITPIIDGGTVHQSYKAEKILRNYLSACAKWYHTTFANKYKRLLSVFHLKRQIYAAFFKSRTKAANKHPSKYGKHTHTLYFYFIMLTKSKSKTVLDKLFLPNPLSYAKNSLVKPCKQYGKSATALQMPIWHIFSPKTPT